LSAGALALIVSIGAFQRLRAAESDHRGHSLEGVNLNPSPTELVPERETSPATAAPWCCRRALPQLAGISAGANVSGWVRKNAVDALYESSRQLIADYSVAPSLPG